MNHQEKKISFFRLLLLFLGIGGMVFSLAFDFFINRVSHFGLFQMAGFGVCAIITLAGLRRIVLRGRVWDGLLLLVYVAGILFMGLRADGDVFQKRPDGMLQNVSFSFDDAAINFLGFAPLGYLMMSYLLSGDRISRKFMAGFMSITICIGLSLLIESAQYFIPGRTSSRIDLLINGSGAFCGIIYCLLEKEHYQKAGRHILS